MQLNVELSIEKDKRREEANQNQYLWLSMPVASVLKYVAEKLE